MSELLLPMLSYFLLIVLKREMGCISYSFSYQKLGISSMLVPSKMGVLVQVTLLRCLSLCAETRKS